MDKLILLLFFFIMTSCQLHKGFSQLQLVKVYDVITHNELEPSGLTLWDDEFYTVSDKHNKIYHLSFEYNKVVLKPFIDIDIGDYTSLDFEGITHDEDYFYLVSERFFDILKISKDGSFQKWLTLPDDIRDAGKNVGLFQKRNAYIEGICSLDQDSLLLVAERQPRGFIEYDINTRIIKAYQKNQAVFKYQDGRSPDFTGLSCADGIYVLDRNAYMIAQLKRIHGEFSEIRGYSYAHIVNQDQLKYQDMSFGHAEGLVVKGNKVYIILDNNRNLHSDGSNNNSLFLELKK